MTDYTKLKRLADELIAANDLFFNESPQCNEVGDAWSLANDRFTEAASPEVILALIAENERLFKLLERTVDQHVPLTELDGVPGWSRAVELVEVVAERDQLKAENERLERNRDMWKGQVERQCETIEALRKALKAAEDAMWHADGNMDGEAADARDDLAAAGKGEQS